MAENSNNAEDVLTKLTEKVVICESLPVLPLDYSIFEGTLVYNEEWAKTIELQLDLKVENNNF